MLSAIPPAVAASLLAWAFAAQALREDALQDLSVPVFSVGFLLHHLAVVDDIAADPGIFLQGAPGRVAPTPRPPFTDNGTWQSWAGTFDGNDDGVTDLWVLTWPRHFGVGADDDALVSALSVVRSRQTPGVLTGTWAKGTMAPLTVEHIADETIAEGAPVLATRVAIP